MRSVHARLLSQLAIGVSTFALVAAPGIAAAQDAAATVGNPGPSQTDPQTPTDQAGDDIVVTGIRASLRESINLKRNAQGVVDAISAEDIGKFPDTNLAESLQRITGVSIDRSNGEGQFVTVRGFGPEYNLVVLNGRQMPTSVIGDGNSAPVSRSFDFANLASEGVASLEVYKSGRATVPSGGIGSTINIRTPRPFDKMGLRGSLSARGVVDTSQNGKNDITPEVSGIFSDTFADDRIGILITGAYQKRHFSVNQANVGWRDGYLGSENNWGSLAQPGDPRYANITNRPDATDVYQVPQNAGYDVVNGRRERINGQAVLQFRPTDSLTATVDYTYSRNTVDIRDNSVGIWYNHNDTSSAWTDGPVAGPIFYTERFNMYPGIDPLNKALITPTGNAFRNAYFRDEINQVRVSGHYDHDQGFLDSLDWGFEFTDNKVRSAYGVLQNDTWGGTGGDSAAQRAAAAALVPDDIFQLVSIPDKFSGISGANDPSIVKSFYSFDLPRMVSILDAAYGICGGDNDCRTPYTTDRRIHEKTISPYFQFNGKFDMFSRPGHLIAGVRWEDTVINSSALVPTPVGTRQNSQNEFNVLYSGSGFTTFKGHYQNWLPSVDFDIEPLSGVKLRASYSHTITRADYGSLQGGRTLDTLFRVGGGTGQQGNPGLIPYKSKNIDLSAEWYYGNESYISVGYFHKNVSNYIGVTQVNTPAFGLTTPVGGPRYQAALAALGANATFAQIRDYIGVNFPNTVTRDAQGNPVTILGQPNDPLVNFVISTPFNSDQTAAVDGFEFAIQHNFWHTGFGTILNYTIVNGNRKYDNTLPASISQFAITGLSDSANAVLFFDKYGLQARAAYNWRAEYLSGSGINPYYIESYGQLDASASYAITPNVAVFAEGINLTGTDRRGHLRSDRNVFFSTKQDARYSAGVRFTF